MTLATDLQNQVHSVFQEQWSKREGQVVPDPEDLRLTNDAIEFERATVLYADLSGSTDLVDSKPWTFAAEIYKSFLLCAARLVRECGGDIVSYDGDRVMGLFIGSTQTSSAAQCGMKINYVVQKILMPALIAQYPTSGYVVKQDRIMALTWPMSGHDRNPTVDRSLALSGKVQAAEYARNEK